VATPSGTTSCVEARRTVNASAQPLCSIIVSPPARPPLPLWLAVVVGAGGGVVYDGAFPAVDLWPLVFAGLALMLVALIGRSVGGAVLVGFCSGLTFYLTQVSWTALYLGPLPWIALSVFESLLFALGAVAIALAYRWMPRAFPSPVGRLGLLPVVVAGLWTGREWLSGNWPYGGFAWGRAALSQSESPFAHLVAWFGISGVSFVLVWLVAVGIECARHRRHPFGVVPSDANDAAARRPWVRAGVAVAAVALVLAVPLWPATTSGTTRIGAVQGNGPAGYFDPHQPGDVMNAQISATLPLIGKKVDMVVWPEGSADIDPTRDWSSAAVLNNLGTRLGAPMIVGTITHRHGKYFNTSTLWHADAGQVDYYDKKHPVPFGEYVPNREFWRMFAPDLIDLIGREYTFGTTDAVLDVGSAKTDGRSVLAGIAICFDIVDDQLMTEMIEQGAQIVFGQTNNADFGFTDEGVQQLAIARIRAIETGRSVVNISTVGTSAIIYPDGSVHHQLTWYTPDVMVDDVPLSTTMTPAVVGGRQIEWLVSFGAVLVLAVAAFQSRPVKRRKAS
jgi:apolipoprotein N-acyltransferase